MSRAVAVVVDPYSSGSLLAPAFRAAGITPLALLTSPSPPAVVASSYRPGDFETVIVHSGSVPETIDRVRAVRPRCVVAGFESGVEMADLVAADVTPELANRPDPGPTRRHKGLMAAAVAARGLPTIRQVCAADEETVAAWIQAEELFGHDLVVKPSKSAGTDDVTRVCAGDDWRPAFRFLLGKRNRIDLVNEQLVVQEHVTGTEYVVDTVSFDGVHSVTDICRYSKTTTERQMAIYDTVEIMPWEHPANPVLIEYASKVLDAVGVRFGAAHSEIMLTPQGPRLIETAARFHGGGFPELCQVATGDSQVGRLVRYCAGERELPPGYRLDRRLLVVFLRAHTSGVLRNGEIYDQIPGLVSCYESVVNVRTGDLIEATRDLFASLALGSVVLAHESEQQVQSDYWAIRALEEQLVIEPPGARPVTHQQYPAAALSGRHDGGSR